ncbi:MAG: hypothetical protein A3D52_01410 [Candidatus Taylorbacteria bacterium RIFCSPHIGHO2_02_FULL_44_36]|uniref:Hint domain-containing protein n=1 Tax=Candidatus Taylorbacteria bacterium RIFCSPLOWO2_12_FULL_44_15c TaxID=1802333 RepID=A0A1G2P5X8_9BACT|nr:MAG: hypothetical protein A3D52_01410 [Candidatus Taylorbacteria bacterium RIFCSPHIGHO2_02_FULL_44_36]OHA43720.1 MAG: hypothetical protein A3G03_02610 [Candidatus Taylorbacteria bacterium RIFCSPLOWO2_12_FULL_44_15c]
MPKNEFILAGKKFITSKKAALLFGYTQDYVGQLCRGGKVDARRIGRTWYVCEKSILEHKKLYGAPARKKEEIAPKEIKKVPVVGGGALPIKSTAPKIGFDRTSGPIIPIIREVPAVGELKYEKETLPFLPEIGRADFTAPKKVVSQFFKKSLGFVLALVLVVGGYANRTEIVAEAARGFRAAQDKVVATIQKIQRLRLAEVRKAKPLGFIFDQKPKLSWVDSKINAEQVAKIFGSTGFVDGDKLVQAVSGAVKLASFDYFENLVSVPKIYSEEYIASEKLLALVEKVLPDKQRIALESVAKTTYNELHPIFQKTSRFIASLFGKQTNVYLAVDNSQTSAKISTNATTTVQTKTVVLSPRNVIQEITKNISYVGISREEFESRLRDIAAKFFSETSRLSTATASNNTYINNVYNTVAGSNNLDMLHKVTISDSSIFTGGTVTGSTITDSPISGSTGSFTTLSASGDTSLATTSVNGSLTLSQITVPAVTTNQLYNVAGSIYWNGIALGAGGGVGWATSTANSESIYFYGLSNVGIGTTSPYAKLSVAGNGAFWNNSSTAIPLDIYGFYNQTANLFRVSSSTATATTTAFVIDSNGKVGVGTSTPGTDFAVQGGLLASGVANLMTHCVTGDTKLRRRRRKRKNKRLNLSSDLRFNLEDEKGSTFSRGGDDDYLYDEVMIKDIEAGDEIQTLDQKTGALVWRKVKGVAFMGTKPIFKLTTASGKTIRTTAEHPYFVREVKKDAPKKKPKLGIFYDNSNMFYAQKAAGWKVDIKKLKESLGAMFEVKFFNFYTALPKEGDPALAGTLDYLKTFEKEISLKTKLLKYIKTKKEINGKIVEVMEKKGDMDVDITLDVTKAIDTLDALLIVSGDSDLLPLKNYSLDKGKKIAFAGYENNMAWELRRILHAYLDDYEGELALLSPANNADKKQAPSTGLGVALWQALYAKPPSVSSGGVWKKVSGLRQGQEIAVLRGKRTVWDTITTIESMPAEDVYDIEVEGTHNFIGNSIVAHNTYVGGNLTTAGSFTLNSEAFTDLTGSGLTNTGGVLSLDTSSGIIAHDWKQQTDTFSVNALTPTTTIPIWIKSTATSSFAGGIESWSKIGAPYFNATSTTATSTFSGGLVVNGTGVMLNQGTPANTLVTTAGGNVGIGMTAPATKLEITSSDATILKASRSGTSGYIELRSGTGITTKFQPRILGVEDSDGTGLDTFAWEMVGQVDADTAGGLPAISFDGRNSSSALANRPIWGVGSYVGSLSDYKVLVSASGNVGIGTTSPYAKLSVEGSSALGNSALAGYFTATTTATSTFAGGLSAKVLNTTNATSTLTGLIVSSSGLQVSNLICNGLGNSGKLTTDALGNVFCAADVSGAGGGAEYDWKQQTDTFSVNALTPTTTIPIWIKSTATSSFAGGIEAWGKIGAPYFNATSTTATSTFAGGALFATGGGNVGIGTTSPYATLTVHGEAVALNFTATSTTATSTFQGGMSLTDGAFRHYTSGVTQVDNLELGNIAFDTNAGWVTWVDLPINSSAPSGTSEAFSATLQGEQVFTVYGEANGSGVITKTRAVVGTSTAAVLTSANIPYGSLIVADGALCVDDGGASNCDDGALTRGNIYAESTSIGLIDLAENYPTKDEMLSAGDLVMLDQDNPVFVKRYQTNEASSTSPVLLGVISTAPGVLLGSFGNALYSEEIKVPVVLAGRVPVKVNLDGGEIAIGDRIGPSFVSGIGAKATTSGQTLGVALEPFTATSTNTSIMVFIDRQFNFVGEDLSDIESLVASTTSALAESPSFIEKVALKVLDYLSSIGTRIAQGLLQVKKLVVDDELCIGGTCVNEAQLAALLSNSQVPSSNNQTNPNNQNPNNQTGPTITIQGNNPAEIEVGATYVDLGVIARDSNGNDLSVRNFVNGVQVVQISLDTSTSTSYTIDYSATDNNSLTATSTRIVNIIASQDFTANEANAAIEAVPDIATTTPPVVETPVPEPILEPVAEPEATTTDGGDTAITTSSQ